ncbi:hypothetical protein ACOZ4N_01255 (plasmid) [Halorientalis pallida]|uniref:hypothetical protein n=1 Tax=Halorientalis pallida TaxID=2479928 RepID=UPI003C6FA4F2
MSRRISNNRTPLPALSLPPGALPPQDQGYEYDVELDPPAVEPIEHKIRLDFMAGGRIRRKDLLSEYNPWTYDPDAPDADPWASSGQRKPLGLTYAEVSCRQAIDEESEYFKKYEKEATVEDAPAFLAHRIRKAQEQPNPAHAIADERERRVSWYRKLIPGMTLYHVLKRSTFGSLILNGPSKTVDDYLRRNSFIGMVVVDDDVDPSRYAADLDLPEQFVIAESALSNSATDVAPQIEEFGIELPAPLLVGQYASGSRYPFLPWGDGLVCSCPYKHDKPWRVLCKHELLAAIVAGHDKSIFLPKTDGLEVPHRARRFVSPDIAASHSSR